MNIYKKMYFTLFNAVSDAMDQLEAHRFDLALLTLEKAQQDAEEYYVEHSGPGAD